LDAGPRVLLESDSLTVVRLSRSLSWSSKMDDAEDGLWLWLSPDFFL
jgi:hypothetical protein